VKPRSIIRQLCDASVLLSTESITEDPEGSDLRDLEAARAYAQLAIREILAGCIRFGRNEFPDCIVILDQEATELGRVLLEECLPERLKARIR
jgi:hypothetical protein